ncbi:exodeoxyribonuclease VII large subunit [Geobacter sp. FeAm09]|uniref:exodeoxyribonuclease VII large subunit n=1 Tax=Geobacter sp. FeAm09 TaxID=2597769 RepID=UPI0011EF173B|nr:exodeoxyribonuclease VII large subunit [Geobacter sp. FeAm09]QEM68501.1 exodeoxyribonuclease VII large subunit [Geobacter sp. FeAm09]
MDIFSEKTILTVSRLTALIRGVLEDNFDQVWVEGEVSNLSLPSSGHIYFTLKDSGAQVRCVMFKSAAKNLKFRLSDGMGLIVRGRISVYDQRGEYQIVCEYLEPAGVGALQMAFIQLKERLAREGLFDEAHKRPMPRFPKRVGVVTSPTGAAIHDILNVLKRRFASLEVLLYPVRVQGDGAAREIALAIADMNRLAEVDVLIVGRGGGSLEDLWAFNEEIVARAVRRSRIPIISAVGHETDWTICDFAADLRAPTPSAAAELVSASAGELRGQVESLAHRLRLGIESYLATREARLDTLRRAIHDPTTLVGHLAQRVDDLTERLALSQEHGLARRREQFHRLDQLLSFNNPMRLIADRRQRLQRLESDGERLMQSKREALKLAFGEQAARLEVLSPLSTLARGYAIALRCKDGTVATDAAQLAQGELLKLNFRRGAALCRVESRES